MFVKQPVSPVSDGGVRSSNCPVHSSFIVLIKARWPAIPAGLCVQRWPLFRIASAVRVHALFVKQQYARTKTKQHDRHARNNAETGHDGRTTITTAPNNDMTGDRDQKLQHAAFQQP